MKPAAKRTNAKETARGSGAVAAWSAVAIPVVPWALKVAALTMMIAYITTCEKAIPTKTSIRAPRIADRVTPLRKRSVRRPAAFISSTSDDACQKKRYGEMVVPRMATSIVMKALLNSRWGTKVAISTLPAGGWSRNAVMTYAKRARVSHLKALNMTR